MPDFDHQTTCRDKPSITSIQTVYLENCSNWYLSPVDGVLTGLWPGKQQFVAVDKIRCSYPTQEVAFTTSPRSRIRAGKTTTTSILLTTGPPIGSTGLEMASRTPRRLCRAIVSLAYQSIVEQYVAEYSLRCVVLERSRLPSRYVR